MSAPPMGPVLYRFAPPDDAWSGTHISELEGELGGSVTGTYDFLQWATNENYTEYCYNDVTGVTNLGRIHRLTCKFSVSKLPDAGGYADVVGLSTNSAGSFYYDQPEIVLDDAGHITDDYFGSAVSENVIEAGTLYDLCIWVDDRGAEETDEAHCQIYIDGELWLDDEHLSWWGDRMDRLVGMVAGPADYYDAHKSGGGYVECVTHVQDIVWTIEGPPVAGMHAVWTMVAEL